ncbi:MAG: hypothetical protein JXA73_24820 [Acidobacteria bacterium]|nr:hypothetical protein [Acidobacteriota bacterium]
MDTHHEENRRSEKRPARGLEDILNLFISDPADKPPESVHHQSALPAQVSSETSLPEASFLLHTCGAVHRDAIISLLCSREAALEEGLHVIDTHLPCHPFGPIDLVAQDKSDRLVMLMVDTIQSNELLLRGIACFDWLARNIPVVLRMYRGRRIHFSSPPRLFLVAPGFSPLLQCVAQRSAIPEICCFIYRAVRVTDGTGILFERA